MGDATPPAPSELAAAMPDVATVLMTDLVDSTALGELLGEAAMQSLWAEHDRGARDLIAAERGLEIGRSDGFLLCFADPAAALAFARGYHALLAALSATLPWPLAARIGAHLGPVQLRANDAADRARGATAFDLDGLALPFAARVMAAALAGQTLVSAALREAVRGAMRSHGHWRLKGVPEPVELFEVPHDGTLRGPPPDSAKAYRVLRDGEGLWQPARDLPGRLPAPGASFLGRSAEQAELARLFDDDARLVTLLGIGGIGKTRLALRHAQTWRGEYPGGTWFCDLSAARGLDGLLHAVAQGLDLPLGRAEPVPQIGAALAGRGRCLVVLDNFEQVARHAEATIGPWLAAAPEAHLLVTSREVLGLAGERVCVLAPLAADEAVQLFRARAVEAGVDAATIDHDREALASLVDLLDRLPLAIELAASRARVMPPAEQLRHIDQRFRLLARSGARQDRQATMRAALDWSWELLDAAERAALAQLSVFEGGFTLEAAAAVIGDLPSPAPWVPDVVQALVEKSLVRRVGAGRFDLLRTVQDYALDKLENPVRGSVQRRHWQHFAALDERRALAVRGADTDNLVAACRRAADGAADTDSAALLLQHAWAALSRCGPLRAGIDLASAVLNTAGDHVAAQVAASRVRAAALAMLGRRDAALRDIQSGLAQSERSGLDHRRAQFEVLLAEHHLALGAVEPAAAALARAESAASAAADAPTSIMVCDALGWLEFSRARYDSAERHFAAGLALARSAGEQRWEYGLLGNLGSIAITTGRPQQARPCLEESLRLADAGGDRLWAGNARCNLGLLLLEQGDMADARVHLEHAAEIARLSGERRLQATAACNLGLTLEALGDFDGAAARHAEAVAAARALGDRRLQAQLSGYEALLAARRHRDPQSPARIEAAIEIARTGGDPAALGLLRAQHAWALAALGDIDAGAAALAQAMSCLSPLGLDDASEPMRTLRAARAAISR